MKISEEMAKEAIAFLKSTKQLVVEQAPDFIAQVLQYSLAESVIYLLLACAMAYGAARLVGPVKRMFQDSDPNSAFPAVYGGAGIVAMSIGSVVLFSENIFRLAKIILAPKLFLLEYFANLVK